MSERIEAIRKENNAWLAQGSVTKRSKDTALLLDHIDKLESAIKNAKLAGEESEKPFYECMKLLNEAISEETK